MKRIKQILAATMVTLLLPFAIAAGQETKNEQRIKIVIAEDDGSKVILDTLVTGNSANDSIVMKDGRTIYLVKEDGDGSPGTKGSTKYIFTTSSPEGKNAGKQVKKEVTIISSESDMADEKGADAVKHIKCETLTDEKNYSFIIESDSRDKDTERTKYVISRDGIVITVEGSDYSKVKEVIENIEKTLDKGGDVK